MNPVVGVGWDVHLYTLNNTDLSRTVRLEQQLDLNREVMYASWLIVINKMQKFIAIIHAHNHEYLNLPLYF